MSIGFYFDEFEECAWKHNEYNEYFERKIVRCKDCKYANKLEKIGVLSCNFWNTHATEEQAFCSYGKRKED